MSYQVKYILEMAVKAQQTGLNEAYLEACNDALDRLQTDYLDLFFATDQ